MKTEIREGGRIFRVEFYPFVAPGERENARDSENLLALVPHFDIGRDAMRSIIEIGHAEGKCRGRSRGAWSVGRSVAFEITLLISLRKRDENVRTLILSRLAVVLKRHPRVFPSFAILRDKFIKFRVCYIIYIRVFSLLPVTFRSPFHSFPFPVIGFL